MPFWNLGLLPHLQFIGVVDESRHNNPVRHQSFGLQFIGVVDESRSSTTLSAGGSVGTTYNLLVSLTNRDFFCDFQ